MKEGPDIATLAALIGDPARANMLVALMTGKALTMGELAREAGVSASTASSHVARLHQGGLIRFRPQGRHKYVALAHDDVAQLLERLMGVAALTGHRRSRTGPRDAAMRHARVCYHHLAGELGTRLFDGMVRAGHLQRAGDRLHLTPRGDAAMRDFGIDLDMLGRHRAPLCRECLDWSERRAHLAGALGRALLARFEALGWMRRDPASRTIHLPGNGAMRFEAFLAAFDRPAGR